MIGRTLTFSDIANPDSLASNITNKYTEWDSARRVKVEEWKELRNYVFQTSTRDTTNSKLPWKNSTATPKLCQIRDNLHANYMAALFPNEEWLRWQGGDSASEEGAKRAAIEAYLRNKTEHSNFRATVSQWLYDWIDTGNVFGTTEYVNSIHDDGREDPTIQYVGPRAVRLSPYDIVFNPLAASFDDSPKIIRSIQSLGDIKKEMKDHPEKNYLEGVFDKLMGLRESVLTTQDADKTQGFQIDGFGTITQYFSSGMVELLDFYGDLYDDTTGKLYENYHITIADRAYVIRMTPIPGWNKNKIRHVGWRLRPDNLYAMGPLDNLVGMQYRIDHLENLKADVFDLIAHPVMKIKGMVEDFVYEPGARIVLSDDGDVSWDRPPDTVLNADTQIAILEQKMEEFAGAPKQAMGIRTPGEKTKFEVQTLENAAGRIFQNKTSYFEQMFLEPILNDMLEVARRNLNTSDSIRVMNDEIDVALFKTITKDDITANGRLRPIGARHFATKANMLQNLVSLSNSSLLMDEGVKVHFSGIKLARLLEELMEIEKFGLVEENVRIFEQLDTQRLLQSAQETAMVEQATPAGVTPDEM